MTRQLVTGSDRVFSRCVLEEGRAERVGVGDLAWLLLTPPHLFSPHSGRSAPLPQPQLLPPLTTSSFAFSLLMTARITSGGAGDPAITPESERGLTRPAASPGPGDPPHLRLFLGKNIHFSSLTLGLLLHLADGRGLVARLAGTWPPPASTHMSTATVSPPQERTGCPSSSSWPALLA